MSYYPYIFEILFVYVENAKHVSYSLFRYIYFWILSVNFRNLIRIYWKCKTSIIFIISKYFLNLIRITCITWLFKFFEYYPYIFRILFVYIENVKYVSYSLFSYIHFWILSVYFRNLIRTCWKCKTCVIFIIQYLWILSEYFLNMLNMKTWLFKFFEYYSYIFRILFVYVKNAKHVSYSFIHFLNIIRIFAESYSNMIQKNIYDLNIIRNMFYKHLKNECIIHI